MTNQRLPTQVTTRNRSGPRRGSSRRHFPTDAYPLAKRRKTFIVCMAIAIVALSSFLPARETAASDPSSGIATLPEVPTPSQIETWTKALDSSDKYTRANAIGKLSSAGDLALPTLVDALRSEDLFVRQSAIIGIHALGRRVPEAIAPLSEIVASDPNCARWALSALSGMGPEAVPTIERALQNDELILAAIHTLEKMGADGEGAVPALIQLVGAPQRRVRCDAACAAATISAKGVESLVTLCGNDSAEVRVAVACGLGFAHKLNTPDVAALEKLLKDGDPRVRAAALGAVERLGTEASPLVAVTAAAFKDTHRPNRLAAAMALSKVGEPAIPVLLEGLRSADAEIQHLSARSLGNVSCVNMQIIVSLQSMLNNSDNESVRLEAERALQQIRTTLLEEDGKRAGEDTGHQ